MTRAQKQIERLDALLAAMSAGSRVLAEAKFLCGDVSRLTSSGLAVRPIVPRHFEDNWVYLLPDGPDRNQQRLRVRYLYDATARTRCLGCLLTYKGTPSGKVRAAKRRKRVRERVETTIAEPDQVELILARLGLTKCFRYQKYRSVYRIDLAGGASLVARFDETPLDDFLELEGEPAAIDEAAGALGYAPEDAIVDGYCALWRAACQTRRAALPEMLFTPGRPT